MAKDKKKHQKALQRKAAKRKKKKASLARPTPAGDRAMLRRAGNWPIYEILLTDNWDEEGSLVQALVARQSESGQLVAAVFLVDLECLGVKNVHARSLPSHTEYQELRNGVTSSQPMAVTDDLNLVAKIIEEGIAYASQFGFKPHPDYHKAKPILGDANPEVCPVQVPLGGPDGKPLFVAGPYDNVDRIVARLTKAVGPDGFGYVAPLEPDTELLLDDEAWE
jgi:hypothetical protein